MHCVLVADDILENRSMLQALLQAEGHHVLLAADGQEALDLAAAHRPDLVVLDVQMPRLDGYAACRQLRAHPALADLPILMAAAVDDRDARQRGIGAGVDDFIAKPYNRLELRARVRGILRLNRFRRLLDEEQRFRWVVDGADTGVLEAADDGTILYANATAARLLGDDDASGLIGESFMDVLVRHYRFEVAVGWTSLQEGCTARVLAGAHGRSPVGSLEMTLQRGPTGSTWMRVRDVSELEQARRDLAALHESPRERG